MDKKHSNKWSDFKTSLELTQEELTEIVEQQVAENQGATIVHVDDNPRRR